MLVAAAAATSATAACQPTAEPEAAAVGVPDVLVARTRDGLAVVRDGRLTAARAGVLSMTGSTLCQASRGAGRTRLDFLTTLNGTQLGSYALDGAWAPRVASADGSRVALAAPVADPARPQARTQTTIVIADAHREILRRTLPGALEPDAFAADRESLFVLEWLPATAPDHYRVRRLDLGSGALHPLFTRDKRPVPAGAEEEMRGEGRLAVPSSTGRVLYTLYTHQPGHQHTRDLLSGRPGNVHAFVHTLETEQGWAYCVDLPEPFGRSPGSAHTLALSADGSLLFVADVAQGRLARISTETLKVVDVVPVAKSDGSAFAAATERRVYLGAGSLVQVLDLDGRPVQQWQSAAPVRGLAVSRDLARVYVAREGTVTWRDTSSGAVGGEAALPGLIELVRVV
jgi:hypothetical protein